MPLTAPSPWGPDVNLVSSTAPQTGAEQQLAWSQDQPGANVAPAEHLDYGDDLTDHARPEVRFNHGVDEAAYDELPPLPFYRRPGVLFGAAAVAVLVAAAGLIYTLNFGIPGISTTPAGTTGTQSPPATADAPAPAPASVPAPAPAPPTNLRLRLRRRRWWCNSHSRRHVGR